MYAHPVPCGIMVSQECILKDVFSSRMCSHHANPRTHGGAHLSGLRPHGHAEVHRWASCCSTSASKMASTNGRMRAQGPMTDLALTLGSSGERRGGVFMTVSVRLNHDDAMLFRKYAEMNGISMSELVRRAVLERIEDDFDMKCYEKAMKEYHENPETFTLDEVEKELGLA